MSASSPSFALPFLPPSPFNLLFLFLFLHAAAVPLCTFASSSSGSYFLSPTLVPACGSGGVVSVLIDDVRQNTFVACAKNTIIMIANQNVVTLSISCYYSSSFIHTYPPSNALAFDSANNILYAICSGIQAWNISSVSVSAGVSVSATATIDSWPEPQSNFYNPSNILFHPPTNQVYYTLAGYAGYSAVAPGNVRRSNLYSTTGLSVTGSTASFIFFPSALAFNSDFSVLYIAGSTQLFALSVPQHVITLIPFAASIGVTFSSIITLGYGAGALWVGTAKAVIVFAASALNGNSTLSVADASVALSPCNAMAISFTSWINGAVLIACNFGGVVAVSAGTGAGAGTGTGTGNVTNIFTGKGSVIVSSSNCAATSIAYSASSSTLLSACSGGVGGVWQTSAWSTTMIADTSMCLFPFTANQAVNKPSNETIAAEIAAYVYVTCSATTFMCVRGSQISVISTSPYSAFYLSVSPLDSLVIGLDVNSITVFSAPFSPLTDCANTSASHVQTLNITLLADLSSIRQLPNFVNVYSIEGIAYDYTRSIVYMSVLTFPSGNTYGIVAVNVATLALFTLATGPALALSMTPDYNGVVVVFSNTVSVAKIDQKGALIGLINNFISGWCSGNQFTISVTSSNIYVVCYYGNVSPLGGTLAGVYSIAYNNVAVLAPVTLLSQCVAPLQPYFSTHDNTLYVTCASVGLYAIVGTSARLVVPLSSPINIVSVTQNLYPGLYVAAGTGILFAAPFACPFNGYATSGFGAPCVPCPTGSAFTYMQAQADANVTTMSMSTMNQQSNMLTSLSVFQCKLCVPGRAATMIGLDVCTTCQPGKFASIYGATACSQCNAGMYADTFGAVACTSCPPGSFGSTPAMTSANCSGLCKAGYWCPPASTANDSIACSAPSTYCLSGSGSLSIAEVGYVTVPVLVQQTLKNSSTVTVVYSAVTVCPPGYYCMNGVALSCPSGSFSASTTSASCTPCAVGTSSNAQNATTCSLCAPGKYQPQLGATGCLDCVPGTYTNVSSLSSCSSCPVGAVAPLGSSTCNLCAPGKFFNMETCEPCSTGTYSSFPGSLTCTLCASGTVSDGLTQATTCFTCGKGYFSDSRTPSAVCFQCAPGTYALSSGSSSCSDCLMAGSFCSQANVTINSGYYGYILDNMNVNMNMNASSPNSNSNMTHTLSVSMSMSTSVSMSVRSITFATLPCPEGYCQTGVLATPSQCAPNRLVSSPLCGQCIDQYSDFGGTCVDCRNPNQGYIALLALVCWLYVIVIVITSTRAESYVVGIFLYYVQTSLLVAGPAANWLSWLQFFNFTPRSSTSDTNICPIFLTPIQTLALNISIPFLFFFLLFLTGLVNYLLVVVGRTFDACSVLKTRFTKFSLSLYLRSSVSIFLFSYSQVSGVVLSFLHCIDVGNGDSVVFASPAISCNSDGYKALKPIVVILLIVDVIGAPLVLAVYLYMNRSLIQETSDKPTTPLPVPMPDSPDGQNRALRLTEADSATPSPSPSAVTGTEKVEQRWRTRWGILFEPYRTDVYFWHCVVLFRRVSCVLFATYVIVDLQWRFFAVEVLHLCALLMHLRLMPYAVNVDNYVETVSMILIVLLSAVLACDPPPYANGTQVMITLLITVPSSLFLLIYTVCQLPPVRRILSSHFGFKTNHHDQSQSGLEMSGRTHTLKKMAEENKSKSLIVNPITDQNEPFQ